jgi:hypothetical protein
MDLNSRREFRTPEIPIVGAQPSIKLWTGEPATYGKNPLGWPLYRVIWSASRYYLLGGEWGDNGRVEYRWTQYYARREEWVLEKWLTAEEWAGPEADWQADTINYELCARGIVVYTMGPYPRLGWYEHCFSFPSHSEPNLACIVPLLEASKHLGLARIKQGLRACHDKLRKDWEERFENGFREAQPAFGGNPSSVAPAKPHADTGGLLSPGEARRAVEKYRGKRSETSPASENSLTPEELDLPAHGFAIKQGKR